MVISTGTDPCQTSRRRRVAEAKEAAIVVMANSQMDTDLAQYALPLLLPPPFAPRRSPPPKSTRLVQTQP